MIDDRPGLQMVPIEQVTENPLNPRITNKVDVERLANLIREVGWADGITAYYQSGEYIILGGHRRYHAGLALQCDSIPVYVVPKPETPEDELRIITSLQGDFTDWSPYEWGRFIYNGWVKMGKPPVNLNKGFMTILSSHNKINNENEIRLMLRSFEIISADLWADWLENDYCKFSLANKIAHWVHMLKHHKPVLYDQLDKEYTIRQLFQKAKLKCFNEAEIRRTSIFLVADDEHIIEFITKTEQTHEQFEKRVSYENFKSKDRFKRSMNGIRRSHTEFRNLKPETSEEYVKSLLTLNELKKAIQTKREAIKRQLEELEAETNRA